MPKTKQKSARTTGSSAALTYGKEYAFSLQAAAEHIGIGESGERCLVDDCRNVVLPTDIYLAPQTHRAQVANALRALASEIRNAPAPIQIELIEPNDTKGLPIAVFRDVLFVMRAVLV